MTSKVLLLVVSLAIVPLTSGNAIASSPMVVLPVEFNYLELSAGGVVDTLPDRTESAERNLAAAVTALPDEMASNFVEIPELSAAEAAALNEHVALLDLVLDEAQTMIAIGGWRHKRDAWDYSIGPGLSFLADRAGVDHAVFIGGAAMQGTPGRWLVAFVAAAAIGASVSTGGSRIAVGVVNLRTGNIEWVSTTHSFSNRSSISPDNPEGASSLLERVSRNYPESNVFRARAH